MSNLSQEEKLKRAEAADGKKAEKESKDLKGQEIEETAVSEAKKAEVKEKEFVIKVDNNPQYCGIGAGGIQFANGQAVTKSKRMASWFREHSGYTVSER